MKFNCYFALLAVGGCTHFSAFAAEESKPLASNSDLLHRLDEAYVGVFEKVAPSVVIIDVTKKPSAEDAQNIEGFDFFFRDPNGDDPRRRLRLPQQVRSEGSGFIIHANGYLLTNFHVIEDAGKIDVKLRDGRHFAGKVVGADEKSDIAVVKIEATDLPVAELGNSDDVRVGQQCFAIGIPYNLDYSFSRGLVSAKGRTDLLGQTDPKVMYEDYIQTDALINPGNSGGPLFDIDGRVIGMNTLINGIGRGLAFAIPSNMLTQVGEQLVTTGKITRPWLGITMRELGKDVQSSEQFKGIDKGVRVLAIVSDAPAYKSDLRSNDIITAVDGVALATALELQKEILKKKIGQSVELTVWRGGQTIKVAVTTGELPSDVTRVANSTVPKPNAEEVDTYGLSVHDESKQPMEKNKTKTKPSGAVVVTNVESGSPADEAGIKAGDLIAEVDEKPVANALEFRAVMSRHDSNKSVMLLVEHKGQKTYAVIKTETSKEK